MKDQGLRILTVMLIAAQRPDPSVAYRARVDAYRAGTEVSDADLGIHPVAIDDANRWTVADLQAAAMLHTDVCLRLVRAGRRVDSADHLNAAAALLRTAVSRDESGVDYARRWRDTVAGLLEAFGASDLARDLDARGHEWWPLSHDAAAARKEFEQGRGHEIQAAVAGRLSGPPAARPFAIPPDAISALRHAAEDYTAALASDPANTPASLHLGRVFLLLGREAEAVTRLDAASSSMNPSVRYLAHMFLGALDERAGRLEAATEHYQHARDAFGWGQSAPLALSHVLMRAGRDTDARETLTNHFTATDGRVCEPLWTYLADPATDLGPTLDELRAELWR